MKVVALHGFLGDPSDFAFLSAITPSIPLVETKNPFRDTAEAIVAFLPKEPYHLIGYSMGGRIALAIAANFPQQISSLTLIGAHPGLQTGRHSRYQRDLFIARQLERLPFPEFLDFWYQQPLFLPCPQIKKKREEGDPQFLRRLLLNLSLAKQPNYWPVLQKMDAKLYHGALDYPFSSLYRGIGESIPGAAHAVHIDNPAFLQRALFLRMEESERLHRYPLPQGRGNGEDHDQSPRGA